MQRFLVRAGVGAPALLGLLLTAVHSVSAHDVHTFGPYTVALGWLHEPAYVGVANAVQVIVKDASGNPVTDITDKNLSVDVSLGSASMANKPLTPTADPDTGLGMPGELEYSFIPTAPGNYTFHLKGSIHSTAIDDNVTASDKTFNPVQEQSAAEFPAQVPASADLNRKIDAVAARLADTSAVDSARSTADHALVLAIIGIVLAVVAAGAAGFAVGRRTSRG